VIINSDNSDLSVEIVEAFFQRLTVTVGIPGHAYAMTLFPYVELIYAHCRVYQSQTAA